MNLGLFLIGQLGTAGGVVLETPTTAGAAPTGIRPVGVLASGPAGVASQATIGSASGWASAIQPSAASRRLTPLLSWWPNSVL